MKISNEHLAILEQIYGGVRVQETIGYSRHAAPETPHIDGIRLLIYAQSGEVVDVMDAADAESLTPKLEEKLRIVTIERNKYGFSKYLQRQGRRYASRSPVRWRG